MLVKVGGLIYDTHKEPVLIVFDDADIDNIRRMQPGDRKYCKAPSVYSKQDMLLFMDMSKADEHVPRTTSLSYSNKKLMLTCLTKATATLENLLKEEGIDENIKKKYLADFKKLKATIKKW